MENNTSTVIILLGVVAVGFLIVLFYISQLGKKKPKITTTPEPKPQATTIESPKNAEPAKLAPEPQGIPVETPKKTEPAQPAQEPQTQSTIIETPIRTEPSHMEEAKPNRTESQSVKDDKEPTPKRKDRGTRIINIEGIGSVNAEKLNSIKILTTTDLLESGATPSGRKDLADKTGISPKQILEWVNHSDLFRIKGVGEEYSDLLEESGVDTVVELSLRNAVNLHAKILEVNEAKKLVRRPPTIAKLESWIKEAKDLPRIIEY